MASRETDFELKSENIEVTNKSPPWLGLRHAQFFILFIGLSSAYAMRVNMSVAIVAITDKAGANPDFPEYNWSEKTRSYLLSSFFWGYVLVQVPAGELARRFGARTLLISGIFICSVLNILTPLCASIGDWQFVIAVRIAQGLTQGVIFPSSHTLISEWACIPERGLFTALTYSGSQFGTFLMLVISGMLSTSAMGWPSIFYFSGCFGIFFCVLFFIFGASSPKDSKFISDVELKLIESSKSSAMTQEEQSAEKATSVPWIKIFTTPAFLVLLLAHCSNNWGFWTLLTEIPSYMKSVLGQDIKSNAILSSLPYLVMFIMCFVFAGISQILNKYDCISLKVTRKLFNSIGLWVPMISVLGLGYMSKDQASLAIVFLALSTGANAACYLGFQVNHIDLSPNFAGILMGITNCGANIMSILAPLLVGFIVTDSTNVVQWRYVFFIASGVYFIGNLMFLIFGKTTIQSWNSPQSKSKHEI